MQLQIDSMTCGGCARAVRATLLDLDAEARVTADPPARRVEVETTASLQAVQAALAEAGFPAGPVTG